MLQMARAMREHSENLIEDLASNHYVVSIPKLTQVRFLAFRTELDPIR